MIILHLTDIKKKNGNGVSEAVKCYVKYESKLAQTALYNLNSNLDVDSVQEFNFNDYHCIDDLPEPFNKPDIVVFNEVYKLEYLKFARFCIKKNIPYVIIPHGCLVDVAQKNRKLKKTIGNLFLFNKFVKNASAIQFLNIQEKERTHFKYKKAIISGNGTDSFVRKTNHKTSKNMVYIGRYSIYHKGLDLMVEMCYKYNDWFRNNNVQIELYGRTTRNDEDMLKNAIREKNIEDIVLIKGSIYGEQKIELLRNSYGFIQTSRHEGQPMGIIEALANGLPCIVTTGTTFAEFVNDNNCGYGIDFDVDELYNAILKLYHNSDKRNEYGNNAVKFASKYFEWNNIILKLLKQYENIISEEKNG